MKSLGKLIDRYNVQVPRYTSYPSVPFWQSKPDLASWKVLFHESFHKHNSGSGIALYIHLPFCESLCTYCGCNKKITPDHGGEADYIQAVLGEWTLYLEMMTEVPVIRELHLGGGTPTFFSPDCLRELLDGILESARVHPQAEFSVEGHPNNTTLEHLQVLYSCGFRRLSLGVQDNDPAVQRIINRWQPFERVERVSQQAWELGYHSVNFDLIYGLPLQTLQSMQRTLEQVTALRPDRIAFYSYAHVPWKSKGQRLFDESDLPRPELKLKLYQLGKELFQESGYSDIGMDHFALPEDDLLVAWQNGTLHRNFMGYTHTNTSFLLGLGVSAISDIHTAYLQNDKELSLYYRTLKEGRFPVQIGHFMDDRDMAMRQHILDVLCGRKIQWTPCEAAILGEEMKTALNTLQQDELIRLDQLSMEVTDMGRHFLRNIAAVFDLYRREPVAHGRPQFSRAV